MSSFPTKKISELVKEKKWDEFREEIKKWVSENGKEKSGMFEVLHEYVKMNNEFDKKYLDELNELKEMLKVVNNADKAIKDIDRTKKIQNKIKDL